MKPILTAIINRLVPYIPKSVPEGSASDELLQFSTRLLQQNRDIETIAETGFNTGVSSRAFLSARPDVRVVSFDIGHHISVRPAKAAIDRNFPGRHELILGDSTETLPAYARTRPGTRFDLVFIDGGHDYEVARADLLNFQAMSHEHTIVIMDDVTPWWRWGEGPTRAWQEAVEMGLITRASLYKNGQPVTQPTGRALDCIWAVGYYRNAFEVTQ
jgi:predicted O-methyltransferase YrrM